MKPKPDGWLAKAAIAVTVVSMVVVPAVAATSWANARTCDAVNDTRTDIRHFIDALAAPAEKRATEAAKSPVLTPEQRDEAKRNRDGLRRIRAEAERTLGVKAC